MRKAGWYFFLLLVINNSFAIFMQPSRSDFEGESGKRSEASQTPQTYYSMEISRPQSQEYFKRLTPRNTYMPQ